MVDAKFEITAEMLEAALKSCDLEPPAYFSRRAQGYWTIDGSFDLRLAACNMSKMLNPNDTRP